jgi:hypothetical protein
LGDKDAMVGHFEAKCSQNVAIKIAAEFYVPSTGIIYHQTALIKLDAGTAGCSITAPCSGNTDTPPLNINAEECQKTQNLSATGQVYPANEQLFNEAPLTTFKFRPSQGQPCP